MQKTTEEILMEQPAELLAIVTKEQLPDTTAQFLIEKFAPFLEQIAEWKEKALALVVTDESQAAEMQLAREGRLALRKVRTTADKLREELKAESLRYGRAVQGVYNVIEAGIVPIEKHLEDQEKFIERMEAKRRDELRIERQQLVAGLHEYFPVNIDLGYMTAEDFDRMYNGAVLQQKAAAEAKAAAEEAAKVAAAKAEKERIAKEKADAEERERLRIENDKLKQQAEEMDRIMAARAEIVRDRSNELQQYLSFGEPVDLSTLWELSPGQFSELLERKKGAFEEQRKANIEAAKLRKEAEEKAAAEAAARKKLEDELQAKKDAEAKAEADKLAAQEAELAKGDAEKFNDLLSRLQSVKTDFAFKSKKHKAIHAAVGELIDKTITYAKSKL